MFVGLLIKSAQRVRAHLKRKGPVHEYVRQVKDYPKRVKDLFTTHHDQLSAWARQSVRHQIGMGKHIGSLDDAYQRGMETALEALRRYDPKKGDLASYIRPLIKFGVIKQIIDERSHGMTGVRSLYDLVYSAETDEQKEKIIERFPELEEISETLSAGSLEDTYEAAQALLKRDAMLDEIEKEFGLNLKTSAAYLRHKERERKTWKTVSLAKRRIQVYRMKTFDGLSFREIANKLGIGVARVYDDFESAGKVIKKVRAKMLSARPPQAIKKALEVNQDERRFALNLERLRRASENDYPEDFVEFILDVLAGLYVKLAGDDEPRSDHN